jgi:hypothetical protein
VVVAGKQRPWRTGIVRLRAACDEVCRLTVGSQFLRRGASTLRDRTAKRVLPANTLTTIHVKVSAKTRRSLLRSIKRHHTVTLRFALTAADKDGNARNAVARSKIVRR